MRAASGLSGLEDSQRAADQIGDHIESHLGGGCDVVVLFATQSHSTSIEQAMARLRERLTPGVLVGAIGEGVVGGAIELEGTPGMAVLAIRGAGATAFAFDDAQSGPGPLSEMTNAPVGAMLISDGSTLPISALMECVAKEPSCPIVGAVVTRRQGPAALLLDGHVRHRGAVGVCFSGEHLHASTLVSQGCAPIGENYLITKASRNILYELGGRPAADVLRDTLEQQSPAIRTSARKGVYLGRVVNEYRDRFGRGDYLIRAVARVLPEQGALALGDFVRVGQTVRFHVRDRATAAEDLALLLDGQKLHGAPGAVITMIGEGRGRALFGESSHDARAISRAFERLESGPERAKPGKTIDTGPGMLPMAGMIASGEIGPVAGTSQLHSNSVCALMLRSRQGVVPGS